MMIRRPFTYTLLGWYLMVPPMTGSVPYPSAPLREWSRVKEFDTATECEQRRDDAKIEAGDKGGVTPPMFALCVASDDPRLKF